MTTFIGVSGTNNTGKSTLLTKLDDSLSKHHGFKSIHSIKSPGTKDFTDILQGQNAAGHKITVAICTAGDTPKIVSDNIRDVKSYNAGVLPDFFVSACHTQASTSYTTLIKAVTKKDHWFALTTSKAEPIAMNAFKVQVLIHEIIA